MKGKLRNWSILSAVSVFVVIAFPVIMDKLIVGSDIPSNITNSEWVSFLGSYVGSLLGGIVSIVGIIMTIEYTKKETDEDRKLAEDRLKEDRRLSKAPFIIESFKNNSDPILPSAVICIKRSLAEKGNVEILHNTEEIITYIILANIGNGPALDPKIIDAEIHYSNNRSIPGTIVEKNTTPITNAVLTNNSVVVVIGISSDLLIECNKLSDFTLTFKIQYSDVMNYIYKQEIKIEFIPSSQDDSLIKISKNIPAENRFITYNAKEGTLETTVIEIEPKDVSENDLQK